jgi:kynurenine formamidase
VTDTNLPSENPQQAPDAQADAPDRRDFFKTAAAVSLGAAVFGKLAAGASPAAAQAATGAPLMTPGPFWPSRWGKDDEAGASNWITPARVLEAAKLIKTGKIYKIGRTYEQGMPLFGARAFSLRIPGGPTGGPFGGNRLIYNDEYLSTEIGQVGTQFDGLGHIGIMMGKPGDQNEMRFYNGITVTEMNDAYGLKKLGAEKLNPIFTRCHLVNVQLIKPNWDAGEEITPAHILDALKRANINESDIKEGDALMFNTGWGQHWMKNNEKYNSGCPGIGVEATRWVISKGICVVGADSWPVEVVPNPDKNLAFPCHGELITKNGIFIHENLQFDALLADRVSQFVYSYTPSPIKGATGSHGCPIAIT